VNPFKKNGDIRYFLFAWRLICGKKTLGETKNLLKLINTFIKKEDFQKINNENLDFGAAVTSLTSNKVSIKTAKENSYEDMKEWMWASANEPVFMSTVYKDNEAWVDGGLKDYLPITYAIEQDVEEIDVIIHNGKEYTDTDWQQKGGIMDLLLRSITIYGANVEESDIMIAKLLATIKNRGKKEVKLNMYFMSPKQVEMTENELIFDKKIMEELLCQGYISVIDGSIIKESHSIRPSNK
jgi:predicted patatin/cPLA2 family phospholipase